MEPSPYSSPPTHPGVDEVRESRELAPPALYIRVAQFTQQGLTSAGALWYTGRVTDEGDQADLVSKLSDELRALYEGGSVRVSPGRDPEKPVVRWLIGKDKGRWVSGSGVSPTHVDAENGRKSAVKQMGEYRALLERLVEASDDPEIRGTFAWVIDQLFTAGEGELISKDCPACGASVGMYKKPDVTALKYLVDQVADKPTHRTEIDIEARSIHLELSEKFDASQLKVHQIDPGEERRRREALGVEVEGELVED